MKFRVTMKNPDALYDGIRDAVSDEHGVLDKTGSNKVRAVYESCKRWFDNGEYLTVEVDTEEGTCVVVEQS